MCDSFKASQPEKEADTTDDIKRLQEVMEALKGLDHLNISF